MAPRRRVPCGPTRGTEGRGNALPRHEVPFPPPSPLNTPTACEEPSTYQPACLPVPRKTPRVVSWRVPSGCATWPRNV